jgi:hypothetical protein
MNLKTPMFAHGLVVIVLAGCGSAAGPGEPRRSDALFPMGGAQASGMGVGGRNNADDGRSQGGAAGTGGTGVSGAAGAGVSGTGGGGGSGGTGSGTGGSTLHPPSERDAAPASGTDVTGPTGHGGDATSDSAGTMKPSSVAAYKVYLGQTHAHSNLSRKSHDGFDGMEMPPEGFAKAKAKGADFYFITDHVKNSGSITPEDYQSIKAAALAATDATFVASAGIEYRLDVNEVNMYGAEFDAAHGTARRTSEAYLDFLMTRPGGGFVQWNHPARKSAGEQKFAGYTPARDRLAALVEVLNGDESPAEASYQQALDLGWHVGPAAGHDNHGDGWFELPTRTGVLATALTLTEIHEAIRQQRVYCSQDPAWKIWYDVNGSIMGTTIAPAASYTATIKIQGGSKVTKVEIVAKGGAVVASGVPTEGVWTGVIPAQVGNFYYVRLTGSSSGVRGWTAPVWVAKP